MSILLKLINYVAFYILWCLLLLTVSKNRAEWGIPVVLLYLVLHLTFVSTSSKREAVLILILTILGALNESFLAAVGVVEYAGTYWAGVSWWTLSLWTCFATTYWHAFSWLAPRPLLSFLLGAVVAPFCYVSIEQVGGISFPLGRVPGLITIGAVWGVLLPLTFAVSTRLRSFGGNHDR